MLKQIDVTGLPEPLVTAMESIIQTYRKQTSASLSPAQKRRIGWLRGKLEVPETFFNPLPHTVVAMFEGKSVLTE